MKILFVAPSSFPINQPEAMVNAKHIKLLCDAGHSIDLVSRGIRSLSNLYPAENDDFYFNKLNSLHVVNIETKMNFQTLLRHFLLYLKTGYLYRGADWAYSALVVVEKLIKQEKYDYIFTKDYPSEIIGLYIAKKYGIKWVATWNDPYIWAKYPEPYGKGINSKVSYFRRKIIKGIGLKSYKNIFPSNRLRDYMLSYMDGMQKESCVIMPHILLKRNISLSHSHANKLRIIHAGSVGRERNPESFLKGLRMFINSTPNASVEVTFLGHISRSSENLLKMLIAKYDLVNFVNEIPPVNYKKSLEIVSEYNIALLIEANCEVGIFLPSKIIDYFQNNKAVFAISPAEGVMSDFYKGGIIEYFANVNDVENISTMITEIYQDFKSGKINKIKDLSNFEVASIVELHNSKIFY